MKLGTHRLRALSGNDGHVETLDLLVYKRLASCVLYRCIIASTPSNDRFNTFKPLPHICNVEPAFHLVRSSRLHIMFSSSLQNLTAFGPGLSAFPPQASAMSHTLIPFIRVFRGWWRSKK
eukprot:1199878-Amphidinium_carterae.1